MMILIGSFLAIFFVFRYFLPLFKGSKAKNGRKGYVYLIENKYSKKVKIGFSVNPASRLKALQTGSSHPLRLVNVFPGTMQDERALHRKFSHLHYSNEWFHASDAIYRQFNASKIPMWKWYVIVFVGTFVAACAYHFMTMHMLQ
jgi:hypothetical protein